MAEHRAKRRAVTAYVETAREKAFSATLAAQAGKCGRAVDDLCDAFEAMGHAKCMGKPQGIRGREWNELTQELGSRARHVHNLCAIEDRRR